MIKRFKLFNWILGIFLVFIIFLTSFYFLTMMMVQLSLVEFFFKVLPQEKLKGVNILAVGIDETSNVKRSDTIIVFHLDPDKNRIGVISIPRDTRVNVEGYGFTKINHSYAHGGINLLKGTVSNLLSIPIDHYVKVDLDGVSSLVDELGGLNINIHKDLYYKDQAGDLYINLKKGKQHLDGQKAIQYLRFRHDKQGDIGRIKRQQQFIYVMANKVTSAGKLLELPLMIKRISKLIDTDLNTKEMINVAAQFSKAFKAKNIQKGTIPGAITLVDNLSYWQPNITGIDKMVEKIILGFDENAIRVATKIKTEDKKASAEPRRKVTIKEVTRVAEQTDISKKAMASVELKLEVLNGYGLKGEAQRTARFLKKHGFSVAKYSNAGSFTYEETLIVDWKGNLDKIVSLANFLEIDPSNIIVYDRPEKPLDVTIVIGKNWPALKERIENEQQDNQ
jgi:polyisoprenyl-teichoic acid--peptidoglycan teichoic acid transferase